MGLGRSPVPTGQSCPCGGRLGAPRPSAVSRSSQWATSAGSALPLSPSVHAAPTPWVPSHSPMAWDDWRKRKKQNKTKIWQDSRPHCCLMPNYSENRLKSDSLFLLKGARVKGPLFALLSYPAPLLSPPCDHRILSLSPVSCRQAGPETGWGGTKSGAGDPGRM